MLLAETNSAAADVGVEEEIKEENPYEYEENIATNCMQGVWLL